MQLIIHFCCQVIQKQPCWNGLSWKYRHVVIDKIWQARKASTIDKYCYALKDFLSFCRTNNIELNLPLDSLSVANYLIFVSQTKKSQSAVSTAVVALKWLYSFIPGISALNNPLNEDFLNRISQSETRNKIKFKKRKKPLSNDMIHMILNNIDSKKKPSLAELRNALIPCLAYALLLRHDEIAHLNCNHISIVKDGLKILIPSSKTDIYREGKFVFLAKDNHRLYALVFRYLKKARLNLNDNHFLFTGIKYDKSLRDFAVTNSKLTYNVFREIVKKAVLELGYDPNEFGTHSCRSGGATDLAPHISEYELLISGRWSDSRSIGSYVEIPQERRIEINNVLGLNS